MTLFIGPMTARTTNIRRPGRIEKTAKHIRQALTLLLEGGFVMPIILTSIDRFGSLMVAEYTRAPGEKDHWHCEMLAERMKGELFVSPINAVRGRAGRNGAGCFRRQRRAANSALIGSVVAIMQQTLPRRCSPERYSARFAGELGRAAAATNSPLKRSGNFWAWARTAKEKTSISAASRRNTCVSGESDSFSQKKCMVR